MAKRVKPLPTPTNCGPLTAELLGKFIKSRRTQENIKIEDAALMCGLSKDTFTKAENARDGVRFNSIIKICNMLGIELYVKPWDQD